MDPEQVMLVGHDAVGSPTPPQLFLPPPALSSSLSVWHERLLLLSRSVEQLLHGLSSSTCIEEDLTIARWKLKQAEIMVEEAENEAEVESVAASPSADRRSSQTHLLRCHRDLLSDLRREAEEHELALASRIVEQRQLSHSFDSLHAEAMRGGNPFVYEYEVDMDVLSEKPEQAAEPTAIPALSETRPLMRVSSINLYTVSSSNPIPRATVNSATTSSPSMLSSPSTDATATAARPVVQTTMHIRTASVSSSSPSPHRSVHSPMLSQLPPVPPPPPPPLPPLRAGTTRRTSRPPSTELRMRIAATVAESVGGPTDEESPARIVHYARDINRDDAPAPPLPPDEIDERDLSPWKRCKRIMRKRKYRMCTIALLVLLALFVVLWLLPGHSIFGAVSSSGGNSSQASVSSRQTSSTGAAKPVVVTSASAASAPLATTTSATTVCAVERILVQRGVNASLDVAYDGGEFFTLPVYPLASLTSTEVQVWTDPAVAAPLLFPCSVNGALSVPLVPSVSHPTVYTSPERVFSLVAGENVVSISAGCNHTFDIMIDYDDSAVSPTDTSSSTASAVDDSTTAGVDGSAAAAAADGSAAAPFTFDDSSSSGGGGGDNTNNSDTGSDSSSGTVGDDDAQSAPHSSSGGGAGGGGVVVRSTAPAKSVAADTHSSTGGAAAAIVVVATSTAAARHDTSSKSTSSTAAARAPG